MPYCGNTNSTVWTHTKYLHELIQYLYTPPQSVVVVTQYILKIKPLFSNSFFSIETHQLTFCSDGCVNYAVRYIFLAFLFPPLTGQNSNLDS